MLFSPVLDFSRVAKQGTVRGRSRYDIGQANNDCHSHAKTSNVSDHSSTLL